MSLLPWQSFQIRSRLERDEVLRLLALSIPAIQRWPDVYDGSPYFCGNVDAESGSFRLYRNRQSKSRNWFPQLHGQVQSVGRGAIVSASVTPNVICWIAIVIGALTIVPPVAVVLAMLFNQRRPDVEVWQLFAVPMLMCLFVLWTSWVWVIPLYVHYSSLPRYRTELNTILDRMADRTSQGLSVLEVPDTLEQSVAKQQSRQEIARQQMRILAVVMLGMGLLTIGVGVNGWVTGEVTYSNKSRFDHRPTKVTLTGERAIATSNFWVALGSGLVLAGGVLWRHLQLKFDVRTYTQTEQILLTISAGLLVLSVILAFWAF